MTDPRTHAPESQSDSGAKAPTPEQTAAAAAAYARAAADEGNGSPAAQATAAARTDSPPPAAPAAPPAPAAPAASAGDPEPADAPRDSSPDTPEGDAQAAELAELSERAAKADEYLALAQRTKADFENYRKRAVRDAAAAQERGALRLVQSLLPAIDNLDRALAHYGPAIDAATADGEEGQASQESPESPEGPDNGTASLVAGIKHVHADVLAALGRVGIESFDPVGEPFDPQFHEAVAQQPVDGTPAGIVVEVFQRGYRLGETVVRPARVVVAG